MASTKSGDGTRFCDISLSKWSHLSGINNDGSQIISAESGSDSDGNPPLPALKDIESEASVTLSLLAFEAATNGAKIFDAESVEFRRHIGTGASMQVYEGRQAGTAVALKVRRAQRKDKYLQSLAAMRLELKFLLSDNIRHHPNIVKFLGFTWQEEDGPLRDHGFMIKPILLVELACPETSTLDLLIRSLRIDDFATKAFLISDIIQGLDAVHGEFFVHGDLKPENILIFASKTSSDNKRNVKYVAKLSDFGYSDDAEVRSDSPRWRLTGTEYWSPPECFHSSKQLDGDTMTVVRSASRDLYSLGLVIWYIISSELPLGDDRGEGWSAKRQEILEDKKTGKIEEMASSFVQKCLSPLRPVADIATDVLQISTLSTHSILQALSSVGGNIVVPAEIFSDEELFAWLIQVCEAVAIPDVDNVHEDMIRSAVWKQLARHGLEWACPEHTGSARLLRKIDLRDSSYGIARSVFVDELLFRGKVCLDPV